VQPFPLGCSRFQLAGISHFAGTSTHSLIDVLSCKTTLSRATLGGRQPPLTVVMDDEGVDRRLRRILVPTVTSAVSVRRGRHAPGLSQLGTTKVEASISAISPAGPRQLSASPIQGRAARPVSLSLPTVARRATVAPMLGLFLVAASLGASNLAASIGIGVGGVDNRTRLRVALVFGLFEAAMPVIGLAVGRSVSQRLGSAGHDLGAGLLIAVGIYTLAMGATDEPSRAAQHQRLRPATADRLCAVYRQPRRRLCSR
jgi:hypothetical protein